MKCLDYVKIHNWGIYQRMSSVYHYFLIACITNSVVIHNFCINLINNLGVVYTTCEPSLATQEHVIKKRREEERVTPV